MKCSSCIGTITEAKKVYRVSESGEKFYLVDFIIDSCSYPAVVSEYVLQDYKGKAEVSTYLRTEHPENGKLFTFLNLVTVKEVADNIPDLNRIILGGVIVKSRGLLPSGNNGMETLPFIIKYTSYDANRNFAHCVAKAEVARRLSVVNVGEVVEFEGSLKSKRGTIEVLVSTILMHRKRGERTNENR